MTSVTLTLSDKRVLVVEDESAILMLIEDMLGNFGEPHVLPAQSLSAGMKLAGKAELDLALLDVNLAGEESYPIAARLRDRRVPFLFVTG
ncbi:response regulator, partial [Methylobacterium segetis]|uniref:response regulator n=1 Tax=Methylobacterium segetis TaxID=2488750 RepID=UPI00105179C9